jgi:hypothetical protein
MLESEPADITYEDTHIATERRYKVPNLDIRALEHVCGYDGGTMLPAGMHSC